MNTKISNIITSQIKVFYLRKYTAKTQQGRKVFLTYDEIKDDAICFGIIKDGFAISLTGHKIYPIYEGSPNTELNQYYVLDIYDYGEPIQVHNQFIKYLEDDTEKLQRLYQETVDWYEEQKENEKKGIINIQKVRVMKKD